MTVYKDDSFIGGTELMWLGFNKHVLKTFPKLLDHDWIVIPPGPHNQLDSRKSYIVWNHLQSSINDFRWLNDNSIKHILFVSNYQQQSYVSHHGIDQKKCFVINNSIEKITPKEKSGKIKIAYHPELSRGLETLLKAIKIIDSEDIELHIFGDIDNRNGWYNEDLIRSINNYCDIDKRIIRHGRISNKDLIEKISTMHMFVYPCHYEETSCISLIEAMAAGLYCIHSNFAALPETSMGLTNMYVYSSDKEYHAKMVSEEILKGIQKIKNGWSGNNQSMITNSKYSWESTLPLWENFYNKVEKSRNYV